MTNKIEITSEFLAVLKARAQKATEGYWFSTCNANLHPVVNCVVLRYEISVALCPDARDGESNADYIAAANPAVVLALIEKIKRLEEEAATLASFCADICPNVPYHVNCQSCDDCPGTIDCKNSDKPEAWREAARKIISEI